MRCRGWMFALSMGVIGGYETYPRCRISGVDDCPTKAWTCRGVGTCPIRQNKTQTATQRMWGGDMAMSHTAPSCNQSSKLLTPTCVHVQSLQLPAPPSDEEKR